MKRKSLKIFCLWLTIVMLLSFSAATYLLVSSRYDSIIRQNVDQEMFFSHLSRIRDISIKAGSADVRIRRTEDTTLKARLYGKTDGTHPDRVPRMEILEKDGQLSIDVKKPYGLISSRSNAAKDYLTLEIYLPDSYINDLKVRTTSGNVVLDSIHGNTLEFYSESGDILGQTLIAFGVLSIHTSSGRIYAQDMRAQNIELHTQAGSMDVRLVAAENAIQLDNLSGNVEIEDLAGEKLLYQTTSGDLNGGRFYTSEISLKSISGNVKLDHISGDLDFNMGSGDITAKYDPLDGDINGESSSGKIEVTLPANAEFAIKSRTSSGQILCPFPVVQEGERDPKKLYGVVGKASHKIQVKTISGDIHIWR